jgi:hypothetical protein
MFYLTGEGNNFTKHEDAINQGMLLSDILVLITSVRNIARSLIDEHYYKHYL